MTWFKVDDGFAFHSKTLAAGNAAVGLWVRAGSWSSQQLTDGLVPDAIVRQLGGIGSAKRLVEAGLLHEGPDAYLLGHGTEGRYPLWEFERTDRRRKILGAVRELVYRRDGYACVDCGSASDLTLDHIYPWSLGGSDDPSNLRTLCRICNARKGIRIL